MPAGGELPAPRMGREMSDARVQLGNSRRSHPPRRDRKSVADGTGSQGTRRCSLFGDNAKLMETEKCSSVLSFNWKEENLLKKKLGFLESMKKYAANAWLREQKTFYKQCRSRFQRLELAHARLLGNRDLVKQLTSKNPWSSYSSTLLDESEAAVKAIVQNRTGWDNRMLLGLSQDRKRLCPPLGGGLPKGVDPQAASRMAFKAESKKESMRATVKTRSPSRGAEKPALLLSVASPDSPEPGAQHKKLLGTSRPPPPESAGTTKGFSRRPPPSVLQSQMQDPDTTWRSKGKFLRYIVCGDIHMEPPTRKGQERHKDSPHDPEDVLRAPGPRTQMPAFPKQEFPVKGGAKYLDDRTGDSPPPTRVLFQDHSSHSLLEKGAQSALHQPGPIGMHDAGREQKKSSLKKSENKWEAVSSPRQTCLPRYPSSSPSPQFTPQQLLWNPYQAPLTSSPLLKSGRKPCYSSSTKMQQAKKVEQVLETPGQSK